MSKRNIYFGGFSLLVAGAAIAGGAAVSSNAMADGGTPADELNRVSVISMVEGGEAIECTFDGIDFPSFVVNGSMGDNGVIAVSGTATIDGPLPADMTMGEALPAGEGQSFSVSVGTDGVITDGDGNVIEPGTLVGQEGGAISIDGAELVPLTPEQMEEMTADMQVISVDDARPGTPEECAAMQPVPATPVTAED
jgi:hypothetical protein